MRRHSSFNDDDAPINYDPETSHHTDELTDDGRILRTAQRACKQ